MPKNYIEITRHGGERLMERLGVSPDNVDLVAEVWDRQMGPDPSWKVPRISQYHRSLRYLSYRDYVFVFQVVDRSHMKKKRLARLITVVGPLSKEKPWVKEYESAEY